MCEITNQIGIITGGNGRLGQTFANYLAKNGNIIHIFDIQDKCLFETNKNIIYHQVDITDKIKVFDIVEQIYKKEGKIDFLINNAALQITKNFERMEIDDFINSINVNLNGAYICIKAVSKYMMEVKKGNIINIGSIYGVVSADPKIYGNSGLNSPDAYAASKGGLIQLTKYLAVNLGKYNIRVNVLSPAGVENNQPKEFLENYLPKVPMNRMVKKEELIGPLMFLLSSASSYITGQNIIVDGGFTSL